MNVKQRSHDDAIYFIQFTWLDKNSPLMEAVPPQSTVFSSSCRWFSDDTFEIQWTSCSTTPCACRPKIDGWNKASPTVYLSLPIFITWNNQHKVGLICSLSLAHKRTGKRKQMRWKENEGHQSHITIRHEKPASMSMTLCFQHALKGDQTLIYKWIDFDV